MPEEAQSVTTRPHGLQAAVDGDGVVTLSWNAPDVRVSEYRILRHRPEEGEPEPLVYVEWTESKDTNFSDTEVEPGVLYVYQVERIDVFGYAHDASEPASVRVPGSDSPALTVSFEPMTESHDGTSAFTLRLRFSEAVDIAATALRDVLAVTGGTVSQVAQVDGRSDLWEVTVMPNSADDVEIRLSPGVSCGAGSVCTEAGVPLSSIYAVLILGPAQPADDSPATADQKTEPARSALNRCRRAMTGRARSRCGFASARRLTSRRPHCATSWQ